MNDFLREKLRELLAAHGRPLIDDRARCEALLWLAAGENSHGMFALVGALERKVPHAILTAPPERRDETLLAKLTHRLVTDLDMDEAAARWAVESWAAVVGAPAQPVVPPENFTPEPPLPPVAPRPAPRPATPPDFDALPSLTLDEPAPVPPPEAVRLNLDALFTSREPEGLFLAGATTGVRCLAFSANGATLATGHDDGTVQLWDTDDGRPCRVLQGHRGGVRALTFAGGQLASAGADGQVKIWDVDTGRERTSLRGHDGAVTSLAASPDGLTLASGGADRTVRVWDADTGLPQQTLTGHEGEVTAVAWSPDGRTLASGGADGQGRLWDVGFGSYWATLPGHAGGVAAAAYAPDGGQLATAGRDGTVRLWNALTASAVATLEGHKQPVSCLAFAPNGWTVATGGADEGVRVWDVAERRELCCFAAHTGAVRALAYSPDGRWLAAAGADGTVRRWRAPEAERPARRPVEVPRPRSNSVGKAGAWGVAVLVVLWLLLRLLSLSSRTPERTSRALPPGPGVPDRADPLRVQDRVLMGHLGGVAAVAVAPDGRTVLTGGFDGTVRVWDLNVSQHVRRIDGHTRPVLAVALDPDGRRALSGSLDGTVRLWDVQTGMELRRFAQFHSGVSCVAFSPDGKRLAAGGGFEFVAHTGAGGLNEDLQWRRAQAADGWLTVWEADSGRRLWTLRGHGDAVTAVAFTPDGRRLVSGSFDRTARLWDLETGREIRQFRGHEGQVFGVAVSPDGKRLLTGGGTLGTAAGKAGDDHLSRLPPPGAAPDNTVRLWDLETGAELRAFRGHWNAVLGVAFSPDGERALSGGFDQTVRLWDAQTGEEVSRYNGHGAAVHAVAFVPNGVWGLSGGWDGNLRRWRLR